MELKQNLQNEVNNNVQIENGLITKNNEQKNFLETTLGKVVNEGLNIGLRAVLPNIIEDQVIDIKDAIINSGFKEGVKTTINKAIEMGKSGIGIITGKFENVEQARMAVKNGGIIDGVSSALDFAVNKCVQNDKISYNAGSLIKNGKDAVLNSISSNIEKEFDNEISSINLISKYEETWKDCYRNKDFDGMEREYYKIKEKINEVLPLEETLKQAREIENISVLIRNNGRNFNLSQDELELAQKLVN